MDIAPLPDIYRHAPFAQDCAPRRLLRLFSGKWTTMIVHTLHLCGGASRPGQLQRALPGLSKKMMTQTLRDLERMGLVDRNIMQVMPPVVEYRLTALGQRFVEPLEMLYRWGAQHAALLDQVDRNIAAAPAPAPARDAS
ncbi:helix-turn-helix transcriptional regulator [Komagataeibacter intermedius]|uniref:HxlR family transcriptional regulator n=2 Tax=Komagataeibacter intermedius TaxID=66229 RepID=A0A0N1F7H0_9PROT|nr:helix-turn-helix domain-containing protein [Komagataeibacter intermedius]KPH85759.1 HxlR family transcriptional regulator [Komagataeibacter intermedius AF2]MCF3637479.1 helix-turn-helix transcriptional regulator [Komagataeibacter intermedius]GAN87278.1 transcriptional regulator MarR/HxlR [Komagataeibacter intermedius TF2]GBQ74794.1 MarR family transcriptional regulator [Komagataeibacter intermedius NRIC 0521]